MFSNHPHGKTREDMEREQSRHRATASPRSADLKKALGELLEIIERDPTPGAIRAYTERFSGKGSDFVKELQELAGLAYCVRTGCPLKW
jgi:hypothetical protein